MTNQPEEQRLQKLYEALSFISDRPYDEEPLYLKRRGALRELHINEIDFMVNTLTHDGWRVRHSAAEWLAYYHQEYPTIDKVIEPLISILKQDKVEECRASAALALGKIGDPRAYDPDALHDNAITVVVSTIDGVIKIDKDRTVNTLISILNDADRDERHKAGIAKLLKFINDR